MQNGENAMNSIDKARNIGLLLLLLLFLKYPYNLKIISDFKKPTKGS